ncbi:ABC transporter permease [Aestuariimicrobium ganziense]|uniref:ABC transporter permease n=1 Tax=Aestuariimicrobium ganziense TaxID=2773677 RepID=UPI0019444CFA|nr:ABC transporter permease [Aestuariimicrobium ganziense]
MIRFIARRLVTAVGLLLALSAVVYGLLAIALDPLEDLRTSTLPNAQALRDARVATLRLDQPWYERYWTWLTQFVQGNPGLAWRTQQRVADILPGAIATSVQLVVAATVLALIVGVTIGVVSALRQYTTFDYSVTFVSFVLFSLPVFWVAVLLKQFMAIELNNYLGSPSVSWPLVVGLSLVAGLFWAGALGGGRRRQLITFGFAFVVTAATLAFIFGSGWLRNPVIGPIGYILIGVGTAVAVTALFAGMRNRRALYSALTTVVVGLISYFILQGFFDDYEVNTGFLLGLLAFALVLAAVIGWAFGGPDRGVSVRGAVLVALVLSVVTWFDRVLQTFPEYYRISGGRPVPTLGSQRPNFSGDYWITQLDKMTHLILPTLALLLIGFAGYVRYERGATLEVLNQDYIRTARSKGLPERVVIVRHALRNALMPLASIVPPDFIAMIGGAVITETIFSWNGMGRMFIRALGGSETDPIMAYIMITGGMAMVANIIADILYAVLDPRIRVNA